MWKVAALACYKIQGDSTVNENIEHRELIRLIRENDIEGAVLCLDRDIIEISKK